MSRSSLDQSAVAGARQEVRTTKRAESQAYREAQLSRGRLGPKHPASIQLRVDAHRATVRRVGAETSLARAERAAMQEHREAVPA